MPVGSRSLQNSAPNHEVGRVSVCISRGIYRSAHFLWPNDRWMEVSPCGRKHNALTREERSGYAKDAVSTGDKIARFESGRPISAEYSCSFGIRRFGAASLR